MMRNKAETWKRYYESIVIRGKFQNPAIKADFERLFRYWKDSRKKMPMAEWQTMQNNWGDLAGKVNKDVNDTWRDFCNLFAGNCVQSASEDKYIDPEFIAALQEVFGETPFAPVGKETALRLNEKQQKLCIGEHGGIAEEKT